MKVYVVYYEYYNDGDNDFSVCSVSYSRETAVKNIENFIKSEIENQPEYIIDKETSIEELKIGNNTYVRLFYCAQHNWDTYITYYLFEKEIEF